MEVISTRDFRSNQTAILSRVKKGESILLKARIGTFKILPLTEGDSLTERVCQGLREAKEIIEGKCKGITLEDALNEL